MLNEVQGSSFHVAELDDVWGKTIVDAIYLSFTVNMTFLLLFPCSLLQLSCFLEIISCIFVRLDIFTLCVPLMVDKLLS